MITIAHYSQWWYIRKYQFVMMTCGTLLYCSINYVVDVASQVYSTQLLIPFNEPFFYDLSVSILLYCFFRLIPVYFAVAYGPWVGMVVAGGGVMLSDWLAGYGFSWDWFSGALITGFITGFALYKTQRSYSSTFLFVTVFASLAQALGLLLPVYHSMWVWHRNLFEATQLYLVEIWPTVCMIFLFLPFFLVLHNRISKRINEKEKKNSITAGNAEHD